jgi:hypothetical protein
MKMTESALEFGVPIAEKLDGLGMNIKRWNGNNVR